MEARMEVPDDGEPRFTVAAVARRLGVAPATLRTWDRRYALGPTDRDAGRHRRYGAVDLRRLEHMRDLVYQGLPAAEAARRALRGDDVPPPRPDPPAAPGAGRDGSHAAAVRGLNRAARALNGPAARELVQRAVAADGVVGAWDHVLRPVLVAAGERWARTGTGIDVEHLLSDCIASALQEVVPRLDPTGRAPSVLLACAEDELHSIPVLILAAALAERGIGAQVLGAALPRTALHAAVSRTGPRAVFIWSQRPDTASPAVWNLPVSRTRTRLVVGGPGWEATVPAPPALLARTLPEAVSLLAQD